MPKRPCVGCEVKEWHRTPESRRAVIANLEWPEMSDEEAFSRSQHRFGQETSGPRLVPDRTDSGSFEQYDKSSNFLAGGQQERNQALWHRVRALPPDNKSAYIARNGLNRVRVASAARSTQDQIRWIK